MDHTSFHTGIPVFGSHYFVRKLKNTRAVKVYGGVVITFIIYISIGANEGKMPPHFFFLQWQYKKIYILFNGFASKLRIPTII